MSSETRDSGPAIRVEGAGKCYAIYDKPHHRLLQGLFRGRRTFHRSFWALRDASFEVARGETVGIVGRNGSGKSTLLQLIAGTLTPTEGAVETRGRVAALLELGAGFNPEFTGRENAYLNASVLGLEEAEIDARFDDILAFADIGDFIDQPVKTYSSGMYLRLAFSVATSVAPDVLIVDEALAVGDMVFQAKCMLRIRALMQSGVTVLFVSHDAGAVRALCSRCVMLERGRVIRVGPAAPVLDAYVASLHLENAAQLPALAPASAAPAEGADEAIGADPEGRRAHARVALEHEAELPQTAHRFGRGGARILDVKLLDGDRRPVESLPAGAPFVIQAAVRFDRDLPSVVIGYSLRDSRGQMLVGGLSSYGGEPLPAPRAGDVFLYEIRSVNRLLVGLYTVSVGVEIPVLLHESHDFLDVVEHAAVFRSELPVRVEDRFFSLVSVPAEFDCMRVASTRATPTGALL